MPSPFPGMDPYLEGDEWTSFHVTLAVEIVRQLAPRLRPKYAAFPQKRFESVDEDLLGVQAIYPDVAIASDSDSAQEVSVETSASAPVVLQTIIEEEAPHDWIEIRDVEGRQLVTTIEILSPWNKRGAGYQKYLRKRRAIFRGTSHLIEIDLLRAGKRLPMKERLPPGSYYVYICRARRRPFTEVWPIALSQQLPRDLPVPLLAGDPDVFLDLQAAFESAYDLIGFDQTLNYAAAPEVPFGEEQAAWVAERLRAAGKLE